MEYLTSKISKLTKRLAYHIAKRFTDYNNLKDENKKLKNEIYTLVCKEDSMEAATLKSTYKIQYETNHLVLFGEYPSQDPIYKPGPGIIPQFKRIPLEDKPKPYLTEPEIEYLNIDDVAKAFNIDKKDIQQAYDEWEKHNPKPNKRH